MNQRILELLNGTLGLFLFLVTLVVIRDLKKKINLRESGLQVPIALFVIGILVFSIGELYKYGPFAMDIDPIIAELFETVYLLLTIGAVFSLLGLKKP